MPPGPFRIWGCTWCDWMPPITSPGSGSPSRVIRRFSECCRRNWRSRRPRGICRALSNSTGTGRSSPGLWLAGYSGRRWEGIILGLNSRGLISPFRPQYQYWVSRVDPEGRALMDSVTPTTAAGQPALAWNPYVPHTIRRQTRPLLGLSWQPAGLGLGADVDPGQGCPAVTADQTGRRRSGSRVRVGSVT